MPFDLTDGALRFIVFGAFMTIAIVLTRESIYIPSTRNGMKIVLGEEGGADFMQSWKIPQLIFCRYVSPALIPGFTLYIAMPSVHFEQSIRLLVACCAGLIGVLMGLLVYGGRGFD